jgi:acyl-CoA reductase-like NAD-dependent aldehyde dehydrogenase
MAPIRMPDRFFIGGQWVSPSTSAKFEVIDAATELPLFSVSEAKEADMSRAVAAARTAFDEGPWPRLTHAQRAEYLRAIAAGIRDRLDDVSQIWTRESGVLYALAQATTADIATSFDYYAGLATGFPFEQRVQPTPSPVPGGEFALLVREPVGVVGAIIPWNAPLFLIANKLAPALLAGCTVVLKASPEAPGAAYLLAEIVESIDVPAGVLNVITADRDVSEKLVRDARVDKISFTGSTAAGRKIGSICGERVARFTLELGGKSAAVILDDADISSAAAVLAGAECFLTGQVCSSLTRIVVSRNRHDELVDALSSNFSQVVVGDPFDVHSQMGPLATRRQRYRVEGFIAKGVEEGATLAAGGARPKHLDRGWFIEPTVFANVHNSSTIAREEIFGPVLSVIPADDERHAVTIANDSPYGLNASVFTNDIERARAVAGELRSGTVGHNAVRNDFRIAFGGFKQSGVGREGGREGLLAYLETKTVILDEPTGRYRAGADSAIRFPV